MSQRIFATLVPIWIGIGFNLLVVVFHLTTARSNSRFVVWYYSSKAFFVLMAAVWTMLLCWAAYEWLAYR